MAYDFSEEAEMTNEELGIKKKLDQDNKINFLKAIFLVCPLCGEDAYIQKVESKFFTTKCKCTEWKINFDIEEI